GLGWRAAPQLVQPQHHQKGPAVSFKEDQRPGNRPLPTTLTRTYCELRTDRVHSCHCQLSSASGGGRTFRALRIPAIRSARNECSTSSRRRIVHGQIESP